MTLIMNLNKPVPVDAETHLEECRILLEIQTEKVNSSGGGDVHDNDRAHILLLTCWVEKLSFGRPLSLVMKGGPKDQKIKPHVVFSLEVFVESRGKGFCLY